MVCVHPTFFVTTQCLYLCDTWSLICLIYILHCPTPIFGITQMLVQGTRRGKISKTFRCMHLLLYHLCKTFLTRVPYTLLKCKIILQSFLCIDIVNINNTNEVPVPQWPCIITIDAVSRGCLMINANISLSIKRHLGCVAILSERWNPSIIHGTSYKIAVVHAAVCGTTV